MNNQDRFKICCHEAGHTVIGRVLNNYEVRVIEVFEDKFGHVIWKPSEKMEDKNDLHQIEPYLIMSIAGRVAGEKAEIIPWTIAKPYPSGQKRKPPVARFPNPAISLAKTGYELALVGKSESDKETEIRLVSKFFPQSVVYPYIYYLTTRTRVVVDENWQKILAVGSRLFWKSQIWEKEFNKIMRTTKCVP